MTGAYNPPLIFGPIPPESNPPIEPQFYNPSLFFISAITTGQTTTVTTTQNHNFVIGQEVRLVIPEIYGASGLNERSGLVLSIPASNKVVLNIVSINVGKFTPNTSSGITQPQIIPIGDINSGLISTNGRIQSNSITGPTVPGGFINVS